MKINRFKITYMIKKMAAYGSFIFRRFSVFFYSSGMDPLGAREPV